MSTHSTTLGLNLSRSNISLYGLPVGFGLAFLPHFIKVVLLTRKAKFDNLNPRKSAQGEGLDAWTKGLAPTEAAKLRETCLRLTAIHNNGFENYPLFFGAVLAGNFARLPVEALNTFVVTYLGSRVAYSLLYFYQNSEWVSWARTGAYFYGMISAMTLLTTAAKKVSELVI